MLTNSKSLVASLIHWNGFASGVIIYNEIVLDNVKPQNKSVQEHTYNFLKGGGVITVTNLSTAKKIPSSAVFRTKSDL